MAKQKGRNNREFNNETKRALAERVAYMCCNPYCRNLTIKPRADKNSAVRSGKACHIISAGKKGPRFDDTKSDAYIRSFANGIWLCDKCGREVDDNQSIYLVSELNEWKKEAESYVVSLVTQDTRLRQLRILTHHHLSALRVLSGFPSLLDNTFNSPNGNGINMTRLFYELELVLSDNLFLKEADLILAIRKDLEENVCTFIEANAEKNRNLQTPLPTDITDWKKAAVKLLMVYVNRFDNKAYNRFLNQDNQFTTNALNLYNSRGIIPNKFSLSNSHVAKCLT